MSKIIIIGGVPRCGKTIIANSVAKRLDVSVVEGDAVRRGLRSALIGKPDVFATDINLSGTVLYHPIGIKERSKQQFSFSGHENTLTLAALSGFISHYEANEQDIIIEGPMIEPDWAHSLSLGEHNVIALFVGYLQSTYFDTIRNYANTNERDWINGLNREQQERYKTIWLDKSHKIAANANENGQLFLDASEFESFEQYLGHAVQLLSN